MKRATSRMVGLTNVQIIRQVPSTKQGSKTKHRFNDYFKGFEEVSAVREIFGQETDEVLAGLRVEFLRTRSDYIWVSDEDGHLIANANYLRDGETRAIYLDLIHELVHVKQFRDGREILLSLGKRFEYVDRPTELEAYKHTIKEARRLGMTDEEIVDYLRVTWLDEEEVRRLARNLGVKVSRKNRPVRRARIT
ncbi:MAG: hypothetical protein ABSE39_08630 [Candidatus Bathyarchaeia archaeon]